MKAGRKISKLKIVLKNLRDYFLSVTIIAAVVLICRLLADSISHNVVSFILLFVVSVLATFMSTGPVLLASTLSAVVWNFFFIPPHFTFHIEKTEDILIFALFFIIAILNGIFTTRVRRQEQLAREREIKTNSLFLLTSELSSAAGINEVVSVSLKMLKSYFSQDALFVMQDGKRVLSRSGRLQKEKTLSDHDFSIAEYVFDTAKVAGKDTEFFRDSPYNFYPLSGKIVSPGVLIINHEQELNEESKTYFNTILALISNALEREFLSEFARKASLLDESDKLYKTLFNSISHELRIPVAAIMGAADSLKDSDLSIELRRELYGEIFIASVRLNRLIENLLNMSRLESGRLSLRKDWYDLNDLFYQVCENLKDELSSHNLDTEIQDDLPLVKIDFGILGQVLHNLILNAIQHTPAGTEIKLLAQFSDSTLSISVSDNGSGFPTDAVSNVFDKFNKAGKSGGGGPGLGLSIVKGFTEAHGGEVLAENNHNGGGTVRIKLPVEFSDIKSLKISIDE